MNRQEIDGSFKDVDRLDSEVVEFEGGTLVYFGVLAFLIYLNICGVRERVT